MGFYELVNLGSGNRIGEYDTEEAALEDVLAVVKHRGAHGLAGIGLGIVHADGSGEILAEGMVLAARLHVAT